MFEQVRSHLLKFGNSRDENSSQSHAPAAVDSSISHQLDSNDHCQNPGAASVALYASKGLFRFEHLSDSDLHDAAAAADYESLPKKAQLLYQQILAQEVTPELKAERVQAFQSRLDLKTSNSWDVPLVAYFLERRMIPSSPGPMIWIDSS